MIKRVILFAIIGLGMSLSFAQNLLKNGSFEQMGGWCEESPDSLDWYSYQGEPKMMSPCSFPYSAPTSEWGSEPPYEGEGYLMVRNWHKTKPQDIVYARFTQTVPAGTQMFYSLKVSWADSSTHYSNRLGVQFVNDTFVIGGTAAFYAGTSITTDNGWVIWSGWETKNHDVDGIAIGNFWPTSFTAEVLADSNNRKDGSFYFIDDVQVSIVVGTPEPDLSAAKPVKATNLLGQPIPLDNPGIKILVYEVDGREYYRKVYTAD